jgi:aminoglycoside phosphotransferase (APT) family kinase protein
VRGERGTRTLIGKVYSDGRKAAAVYDEARALTRALEHDGRVRVAQPEGFVAELAMVVWQPVTGGELEPHLDTAHGGARVRAAAEALATLHALPPVSARRRPVTAELERFHRRATNVARVAPAAGQPLTELVSALVDRSARIDHSPDGLVHGDCKPSQFRIDGSDLALLDFDHCGLADPASDVGTFLASLRQRGRGALEGTFFAAYSDRAHAGPALGEGVAWYESVALLRKALRAFARAPRSPVPGMLAREGLRGLERPRAASRTVRVATTRASAR